MKGEDGINEERLCVVALILKRPINSFKVKNVYFVQSALKSLLDFSEPLRGWEKAAANYICSPIVNVMVVMSCIKAGVSSSISPNTHC